MTDRQEWIDWVKAKRQQQAKLRAEALALKQSGLSIGRPSPAGRQDLTARELQSLEGQIESIEKVIQQVIAEQGLASDT